ncbi:EAL domain-containing protein [Alcaligenaceae bacterium]|nr:EAL domain-containing protein [Alcaligenaceae bacterium]
MKSGATATTPALPPQDHRPDVIRSHSQYSSRQFLFYTAAATLMWTGAVGLLYPYLVGTDALIAPSCGTLLALCAAAMLLSGTQPFISRALVAMVLVVTGLFMVAGMTQMPLHADTLGLETPMRLDVMRSLQLFLLALALLMADRASGWRRLATVAALASIAVAVVQRFPPEFAQFAEQPLFMADLALIVGVLAGAAVAASSCGTMPRRPLVHKQVMIFGLLGTLTSVLMWYALTDVYRHALRASAGIGMTGLLTFTDALGELTLLVCLAFTVIMARTLGTATILRESARQLRYASFHDALTGLPNKKSLEVELQRLCAPASPADASLWVVLVNLDGIKLINDSMGHNVGDQVLQEVAGRIADRAGHGAFICRLEGDEFVIVLSATTSDEVVRITRGLISGIGKPYRIGTARLRLTASAGITARREANNDPMDLIREADLAMACAKRDGRNTWHEYSAELSVSVIERLDLRSDLQQALDTHRLALHYQPLLEGHSGRVVGVEALLRWMHPVRGLIPPAAFIGLAEQTGQIIPLTAWVLDQACRDIKLLKARNVARFPVMVNISPVFFQRKDVVRDIEAVLQTHKLTGDCLEVELTEGVLLEHTASTIKKLNELRALGVKASIDDFGTGYSSLSYLKSLPIEKVKIDQSFIKDVISDQHDAAITRAIISLAHHLDLTVIAEGVETEGQYWFLKRNLCDQFQGFLFARPMPLGELLPWLQEREMVQALPGAQGASGDGRCLLLLDDEENILRALKRLLRRDGYRILTATTPQQAFSLLAKNNIQVLVSDQRMPTMTGTEFFSRVKEIYPETVRLLLSGYTDLKTVTDAINHGTIYKFLTKPWDGEELRAEIALAFKNAEAIAARPAPPLAR